MTYQNDSQKRNDQPFISFVASKIETDQLSFIKGGEDNDDGSDSETNGYVGTEDIITF